jgi:hypothetical protein
VSLAVHYASGNAFNCTKAPFLKSIFSRILEVVTLWILTVFIYLFIYLFIYSLMFCFKISISHAIAYNIFSSTGISLALVTPMYRSENICLQENAIRI